MKRIQRTTSAIMATMLLASTAFSANAQTISTDTVKSSDYPPAYSRMSVALDVSSMGWEECAEKGVIECNIFAEDGSNLLSGVSNVSDYCEYDSENKIAYLKLDKPECRFDFKNKIYLVEFSTPNGGSTFPIELDFENRYQVLRENQYPGRYTDINDEYVLCLEWINKYKYTPFNGCGCVPECDCDSYDDCSCDYLNYDLPVDSTEGTYYFYKPEPWGDEAPVVNCSKNGKDFRSFEMQATNTENIYSIELEYVYSTINFESGSGEFKSNNIKTNSIRIPGEAYSLVHAFNMMYVLKSDNKKGQWYNYYGGNCYGYDDSRQFARAVGQEFTTEYQDESRCAYKSSDINGVDRNVMDTFKNYLYDRYRKVGVYNEPCVCDEFMIKIANDLYISWYDMYDYQLSTEDTDHYIFGKIYKYSDDSEDIIYYRGKAYSLEEFSKLNGVAGWKIDTLISMLDKFYEHESISQPTTDPDKTIYAMGDINKDGRVDVKDVTLLQKMIAHMEEMCEITSYTDVNHDNKINISDATRIQQMISEDYD